MIVNAALSVDEQAELLRVLAHPLRLTILKELTGIATQAGMLNVGYVTIRPKPGDQK